MVNLTFGLEDDLRNKCFVVKSVPNVYWLTDYIKYNNRYGVRALALIHGGNNA